MYIYNDLFLLPFTFSYSPPNSCLLLVTQPAIFSFHIFFVPLLFRRSQATVTCYAEDDILGTPPHPLFLTAPLSS